MKRFGLFVCLLGMLVFAACAAPQTTVPVAPTNAPPKSGSLRVGFTTEADFSDLPTLIAVERLRAQGYTVETKFFTSADLEVAALAQGDLDIGNGSTRTHWSAAAKGAPIVTIMEEAADGWSLVAKQEIKTCADLNGRRAAYSSAGALNAALLQAYIKLNCPDTKPEILLIPSSSARATALLANELDATALELIDALQVLNQAPDRFHTLVNFAAEIPRLKTTGVHARREFATQNPERVRDYIRTLLNVHRELDANPKRIADAAVRELKMTPADAERVTKAYLQNKIWDVNGGLTQEAIEYSVNFFVETGSLPQGLTATQVSDVSYLDAVLNEIGRK